MKTKLIAPCGMNCALCMAYLRNERSCLGCRDTNPKIFVSCSRCKIKNCNRLKKSESKFCFSCDIFPCARLKRLDKRYKTKYGMSMIDNLENIKKDGIRKFINKEEKKWTKGDEVFCVHKKKYYNLTDH